MDEQWIKILSHPVHFLHKSFNQGPDQSSMKTLNCSFKQLHASNSNLQVLVSEVEIIYNKGIIGTEWYSKVISILSPYIAPQRGCVSGHTLSTWKPSPGACCMYFNVHDLFVSQQRERFLRHSDTGPGPAGDWPSADSSTSHPGARTTKEGSSGCARPRAWSVRTFQDFLPPLPQLHKKWCSWNSTSPFTKLVDSVSTRIFNNLWHVKLMRSTYNRHQ